MASHIDFSGGQHLQASSSSSLGKCSFCFCVFSSKCRWNFRWALNSVIAKRALRIQKGIMAARDKRMKTLTE